MVIGELLLEGVSYLRERGIAEPRLDCEVLLAHILGKDRLFLAVHREQEVSGEQADQFRQLYQRRGEKEPIAYIIGHREFMSLDFEVSPGVLIPRPDTETLVEYIIEEYKGSGKTEILDLCTGSGAIGISLAKYLPKSRVTAVDISPVCAETAKKNAEKNGVSNRVMVLREDALAFSPGKMFDGIVSNPPYIPTETVSTLETDVKDFEPSLALDGGVDGLDFYRRLTESAAKWLNDGGVLAFEVGHDQAEAVAAMLSESSCFSEVGFRCDLAGIRRVVYGKKK